MKIIRLLAVTLTVIVVLWLIIPKTDIVSPDWDVLVTDTQGQPLAGVGVTDFSQQYTLEEHDTEQSATTGVDGRVHFAARLIRANRFRRFAGGLRQLQYGAHGGYGVYTYITAHKVGYGEPMKLAEYAQNDRQSRANGQAHLSSHLWLMKCPPGYGGMGCTFPDDPAKPMLPLQP